MKQNSLLVGTQNFSVSYLRTVHDPCGSLKLHQVTKQTESEFMSWFVNKSSAILIPYVLQIHDKDQQPRYDLVLNIANRLSYPDLELIHEDLHYLGEDFVANLRKQLTNSWRKGLGKFDLYIKFFQTSFWPRMQNVSFSKESFPFYVADPRSSFQTEDIAAGIIKFNSPRGVIEHMELWTRKNMEDTARRMMYEYIDGFIDWAREMQPLTTRPFERLPFM